ncbi:MAG: alcohol dehydrogenase catalytic domain-containing protein [Vicinamibacterales bacterium]|nr:alcohol dehydrogenase catalytic domain-containing protein [Vicinamibacterales bacterium]MDP6608626.1 alcohol dehydrogenase catalytic domain-containing protein [Vicinamibacterales bacterium]
MRALWIDRSITLRDVPLSVRADECRIRVTLAGICGTDLQLLDGYARDVGFTGVLGHEFVGVVEEVPSSVDSSWMGQRVVGEINVGCGACDWCHRGVKEHCPARTALGIRGRPGAFAESLSLPAANLHRVPDQLGDRTAVFVEPTAAACRLLSQVPPTASDDVVVLGDGRMGLIVGQVLATTGARVTVVGKHADKLAVARGLGLSSAVAGDLGERAADYVVDATGRPGGLAHALQIVKPRGTLVVKSTFHGEARLPLSALVVDEVRIVGSRCGPFAPAIDMLVSGRVRVEPLIAETFSLDDHQAAFDLARRSLKVLLRP